MSKSLRVRDYIVQVLQFLCGIPSIVAIAAHLVREPDYELQAIAFGIAAFGLAVINALVSLIPGFESRTRVTVWLVLFVPVVLWGIYFLGDGTSDINM